MAFVEQTGHRHLASTHPKESHCGFGDMIEWGSGLMRGMRRRVCQPVQPSFIITENLDTFVPGWNRFQDAARTFEIRGEGEIAIDQILSLGNLLPIPGGVLCGEIASIPGPFCNESHFGRTVQMAGNCGCRRVS